MPLTHKVIVTMTSIAITLNGQCCRLHVVGQQVVNNIIAVRSCRLVAYFLDLIILICYYACSLLYLERL